MPKFVVKSHITHGHSDAKKKDGVIVNREHVREYAAGEIIELSKEEADVLAHALTPVKEAEKPKAAEPEGAKKK